MRHWAEYNLVTEAGLPTNMIEMINAKALIGINELPVL